MKRQQISFFEQKSISQLVASLDKYKFQPKGRFQWLQNLAWKYLRKCGAVDFAIEKTTKVTKHLIDPDTFVDRLLHDDKWNPFVDYYDGDYKLYIGSETYADIMCAPEVYDKRFKFQIRPYGDRYIMGMPVEVIPWMEGAVVLPCK